MQSQKVTGSIPASVTFPNQPKVRFITGLPDLILITNLQKSNLEDGGNIINLSIDPLSPPNDTSPPLHKPRTDVNCDIMDPL